MQLLSSVSSLDLAVPCTSPWGLAAPARGGSLTDDGGRGGGKFWRCTNEHVVAGWAKGWHAVESEFNIRGVGRLDVALVYPNSNYQAYNHLKNEHDHLASDAAKVRAKQERKIKALLVHEHFREWFAALVRFRQTAVAHDVYTFPPTLTAFDRKIVHELADYLHLGHESDGSEPDDENMTTPVRQVRVFKLPTPHHVVNSAQDRHVHGVVAIEVFDTSAVSPLKKARLSRANLPWIELTTLPYHAKPTMPLRVLRVAGHPHASWNGRDVSSMYVNVAPALEAVPLHQHHHSEHDHAENDQRPHKEWRWTCDDCAALLQNKLAFTRLGAVVDWYMARGSRGGYGHLVRRVFSVLEDRDPAAQAKYFLVEGGFDVLNRLHLHEHESRLLGRSDSLEDLREVYARRLAAIDDDAAKDDKKKAQAVVERVAWPGLEPAALFDARDIAILGVPTFPTPALMYPSLDRKLQPAMLWDRHQRRWHAAVTGV